MKRRKFLTIVGATATVIVVGAFSLPVLKPGVTNLVRNWYKSQVKLPDASVGDLQPDTLNTLIAATRALLQEQQIEKNHYEQFFQWHAEKLSGYKAIYEKFTVAVNAVSRKESNRDFVDADSATQRKVLEQVAMISSSKFLPTNLNKLRVTILERDRFCFHTFIVGEVLQLFARTDALILAGYESYRTKPRGLKNYTLAPATVKPTTTALDQIQGG